MSEPARASRAEVGRQVTHRRYVPYSHAHYAGNLVDGAYSLAAFGDVARFRARVSELLERFRQCPPATEGAAVTVGGDRERRARAVRLVEGIPVAREEYALLEPALLRTPAPLRRAASGGHPL